MESSLDNFDATIIRRAWNASTSSAPEEWSKANPARGQCAITAVIVQDCLGGRLIRCVATLPDGSTESHYATLLDHDVILDLTDSQFPEGTEFSAWEERTRDYVMSFEATVTRYETLVRRMNELRTLDKVAAA